MRITLLGIGNILLSDEGYGVRIIQELRRRYRFPANVQLIDGGTLGLELLPYISKEERLLIIDAVNGAGEPGTFFRFVGDEVKAYFSQKVSLHEMGVNDILWALEVTGQPIEEVVVIGVKPESIKLGLSLTAIISDTIDSTVAAVIAELNCWQVEPATQSENLALKEGRGHFYNL